MDIPCSRLAQLLQPYIGSLDPHPPRRLKDRRSRARSFVDWLDKQAGEYNGQCILKYQDHLRTEKQLTPSSIRVYLASDRSWLRAVCSQERFFNDLLALLQDDPSLPDDSPTKALSIHRFLETLRNSIPPDMLRIAEDERESIDGFCPTYQQVKELLGQIDMMTLRGLRDAAVIANMALLGLRQTEIGELDVEAIVSSSRERATWGLRIPDKSGCTPRDIPFAGFEAVHRLNQRWLAAAEISSGPLFRGFYRGYASVRQERLSPRSVEQILRSYPVVIDGIGTDLKPLELRRFAARYLVASGRSIETVRLLLGVAQAQTVLAYLGHDFPRPFQGDKPIELNLDNLEGYE